MKSSREMSQTSAMAIRNLRRSLIPLSLGAAVFGGCMMGPDYIRPEFNLPQHFREQTTGGDSFALQPWNDLFRDPKLQELIKTSLEENRDLQQAVARIAEARAQLGFVRADQFPQLNLTGGAGRLDPSDNVADVGGIGPRNNFAVVPQAFFELDLWGKLARATESERANLLATEYAYRSIITSLVSEVATTYFLMIDLDTRVNIARDTLKSRAKSTGIIHARFKGGIVGEIDLKQAETNEADVAAALASLERQQRYAENAMALLLGRTPYEIPRNTTLQDQLALRELPASLPMSLLETRPDVMSAEYQLHSETARIGVAEAVRLPSLSLTGAIGLQTNDLGYVNPKDSLTWGFGGNVLGPLLNYKKNLSLIEGAEARTQAALKQYEQTMLTAVRDVENALVAVRTYRTEHEIRLKQRGYAETAAKLSYARYDEGVTSYLEVLEVERSLFDAQLNASLTLQQYSSAIAQLYRALGGGWKEKP